MRKWVYIALAVLVAAVLAVMGWQVFRPQEREPVYQGKRLSHWLLSYAEELSIGGNTTMVEAEVHGGDEALRQMGTNAVPTLLRLLQKTDSRLTTGFFRLVEKQHLVKIRHIPAERWNNVAENAFFRLGKDAEVGLPALIDIYERNISPESRQGALMVLGNIGPPAKRIVPSLLPQAADPDALVRHDAVWALAQIHCEPEIVVPVLMKALHDPVLSIRADAVLGLGWFGPNAKQAVPALVELLKDQDPDLRDTVASSLRSIDPEAAARAGVK